MYRISLVPYTAVVNKIDPTTGEAVPSDDVYNVRESMINVLFARSASLTAAKLLEHDLIARKISSAGTEAVLLEDAEYAKLKACLDTVQGLSRNDLEFVRRIVDATPVSLHEAVNQIPEEGAKQSDRLVDADRPA